MEDEAILLKIKRDFTESEAVQLLLKMVSKLETEIGVLKSEVAEAQDMADKIRRERTLTKKQWMQEEMFQYVGNQLDTANKKIVEYKRQMEIWREKYCLLLAKSS